MFCQELFGMHLLSTVWTYRERIVHTLKKDIIGVISPWQTAFQDVVFSNICLYTADTNMSLNTEDARTVYLDLPNYDSVLLIERKDIKMVVAVNEDIVIFIDGMINKERTASLGELLKILQNINY